MKKYSFDFRGEILVFNLKGISSKEGRKKRKEKEKGIKEKEKKKKILHKGVEKRRERVYTNFGVEEKNFVFFSFFEKKKTIGV